MNVCVLAILIFVADKTWGWDLVEDPLTERAFICEVPRVLVTNVVVNERDWSESLARISFTSSSTSVLAMVFSLSEY